MTDPIQAIVLGIVQGLTEYLPISSSAHLILLPRWLGWPDQGLLFDVAANTGTLIAVVFYFRADLRGFVLAALAWLGRGERRGDDERLVLWLIVATIPVGVVGLAAEAWIAGEARDLRVIAVASLIFGVLLGIADRWAQRPGRRSPGTGSLRLGDALLIGGAQALALIPGTSRAGVTMTAGLFAGLDRETAARTSFLLALPVGALVASRDLLGLVMGEFGAVDLLPLVLVTAVSAVTGFGVIVLLLAWLRRRTLLWFVVYRLVLSVVLLVAAG